MARLGDPEYVTWKGPRDVVSGASLAVQEAIVSILEREAPGDAILAEEGSEEEAIAVGAERLWIVDPICGSLNFVQGIPFFGISIALRVGPTLRVGVVHDPMRDETFAAAFGGPATLNGRPIGIRVVPDGPEFWEQSWVGTDLPHAGPRREMALRVFNLYSQEVLHQTVMGSPAMGICYAACGRLHVYWHLDAKPWDVAAAAVILQAAGGEITDGDGGSWLHSDGSYVAGGPGPVRWALRGIKMVRQQEAATTRPPPLDEPV